MVIKFEWERIATCGGLNEWEDTCRAKVFGGWIVRTKNLRVSSEIMVSDAMSESSVFVPDPLHEWDVEL